MKKGIILFLCTMLMFSSMPINVNASEKSNEGVNSSPYNDENLDVLDASAWEYIKKQEEELLSQGYVLEETKSNNNISPAAADDWTIDEIDGAADRAYWEIINGRMVRVCIVDRLYTRADVNDSKALISNLLKIGYNLTIGVKTKFFWKISTALGLDSVLFDSTYAQGDTLVTTEQKAYHYKYYKAYNSYQDMWMICAQTTSLDVHVRAEFSKLVNSRPTLQKQAETSNTYFTKNHSNTTWLNNAIETRVNSSFPTVEEIDFFE